MTFTVDEILINLFVKYPQFIETNSTKLARINDLIQDSLDELANYQDFFDTSFKKALILLTAHELFGVPTSLSKDEAVSGAVVKRREGDIEISYKSSSVASKNKYFPDHSSTWFGQKLDELYQAKLNDIGPAIFVI